jgi:PAS domain S-box-containing protein
MTGDQHSINSTTSLTQRLNVDFALKAAGLGVWEFDPATGLVRWDERCRALYGLAEGSQIDYEQAFQFIHPDDQALVRNAVQRVLTLPSDGQYDLTYRTLGADDGVLRWVRFMGKAEFTEAGEVFRFTGVAQDVTSAQQKAEALQAVQRQYQPAFDNATIGIVVTSKDGEMLLINKAYQQLTGYSFDELYRKSHRNLTHPDDLPYNQQLIDQLGRGEIPYFNLDKRYIRKDGSIIWVRFNVSRLANERGETESLFGTCYDITQQVLAQQTVEQAQTQILAAMSNLPTGLGVFVMEGPELIIRLANTYYYQLTGYQPEQMIGRPLLEVRPEHKDQPYVDWLKQVMASGQPITGVETPGKVLRNGQLEDVFTSFAYTPYRQPDGTIMGVIGLFVDVTAQVKARRTVQESEAHFRSLIEEAPVATCLFVGRELRIKIINQAMIGLFGKGPSVLGKTLATALPELEGQPFLGLLDEIFTSGQVYESRATPAQIVIDGVLGTYYYNVTFKPLRNADGEVYAILEMGTDVTEQVLARQQIEESEARFRSLIEEAPVATCVFVGRELRIELANQAMIEVWGKGPGVLGLPLADALPELRTQHFLTTIDQVYTTGVAYSTKAGRADLVIDGHLQTFYFDYDFNALRNGKGEIYAVMEMATDVTQQILARQQLEEVEARLRAIVTNLPSATVVFRGRELVVETPSKHFIDIIDRGPDVAGKPLGELMPELESQSFLKILDEVYTSGQPYRTFGAPVNIRQADGSTLLDYFDLIYTPLFNTQNEVYAILSVATNVTEQLKSYQKIEASEAALRNAVELAQLGNFSVDVATNVITVSPRVADWFGFDSLFADAQAFINGVGESDRDYVQTSLANALQADSDGRYDVVHSVVHAKTGRQVILHAVGQVYTDAAGQALRLEGTCQDITSQRELQIVLEQQVQDRTEELAAANEEMAATNEELTATNEVMLVSNQALETSNTDLVRSNQNLEQFAYIASHDLQEPLRKIQQFGDLLQGQYGDVLGEGVVYLQRMQQAANRMSVLIRDLLSFSRISTSQVVTQPVALSEVVDQVLDSLSVTIEESRAQLQIDPLPTVQGDELQLQQLFQNLLSNALKFRRKSTANEVIIPKIALRTRLVPKDELPPSVQPTRYADAYQLIEITDNGIGFEEKYLDRIFQVFQRLHGKNEFVGTGVGLAIVQKVVTNHGGAITATSQPGQGATFSVYLPE